MDETTIEILSRHLDGDLSPDEELELKTKLDDDPSLAAQLESMDRVRRSVTALAKSESVPSELDAVVEPLLRARPERVFARPWARWLATAAVFVFGLTVVIELNRRNPGPSISSVARMSDKDQAESTERFTLAPLPTSSLPPERRPLGASDRLLASPIPDVEFDESPPLDVLGPLEEAIEFEGGGEYTALEQANESDDSIGAPTDTTGEKSRIDEPQSKKRMRYPEPSARLGKSDADRDNGRNAGIRSLEGGPPPGRARLFIFIDGESAWLEFAPSATCKPGRYSVRVVVAGGVVHEARPVGGAASASPTQRLCAANLVINLEMEDVADGEYPAEIEIETRESGN